MGNPMPIRKADSFKEYMDFASSWVIRFPLEAYWGIQRGAKDDYDREADS